MTDSAPASARNPFSARARVIIVVVSLLSLAAGFAMAIFGEDMSPPPTADANSYSSSAIGHRVAIELLERLEVPVLVSRHDSGEKAKNAILLLAEPEIDSGNRDQVVGMIEKAGTTVIVLPKRTGLPDFERPAWIEEAELVSESRVNDTLRAFAPDAEIIRPEAAESPELETTESKLATPTLGSNPQLIRSDSLDGIVVTIHGEIVVGYSDTYDLWVISDPDIIANHHIGSGDNAVFWVGLISNLRGEGQAVVVDEVIHGLKAKPSIWRALFEFPLALVTLQVFLITGLLLWAMTGRFGKPLKARGGLEPGKEFLIDNTANLLHFGGYSTSMLTRYYRDTVRYVRKRLHTPGGLTDREAHSWLDRVAAARQVADTLAAIDGAVGEATAQARRNPRRVASTARRIYRWKEEMIHGPANRTAS